MNALTRFEPSTPVRYDVMNAMCTEVEARDTNLQEQINVLKEKTTFTCSANAGYTISNQSCYFLNGAFTISFLVTKTDGTSFTVGNNTIATMPFTQKAAIYPVDAIGKIGTGAYNSGVNGFSQSDKTITVVPAVDGITAIWLSVSGGVA